MPRSKARSQPRVTITLGQTGYPGHQGDQEGNRNTRLSDLEDFALRQRLQLALNFLREVEQTLLRSRNAGRPGATPRPRPGIAPRGAGTRRSK